MSKLDNASVEKSLEKTLKLVCLKKDSVRMKDHTFIRGYPRNFFENLRNSSSSLKLEVSKMDESLKRELWGLKIMT